MLVYSYSLLWLPFLDVLLTKEDDGYYIDTTCYATQEGGCDQWQVVFLGVRLLLL